MTARILPCAVQSAVVGLASFGVVVLGLAPVGHARVAQINITMVESPTFGGATFGTVGAYERIEGTITGAVDPKNPLNADIVDIGLAPRNADGTVGYSADFQILRPIDLSKGNHRVMFDLPNRGRATALTTLNDSTTGNNTTTAGSPGNGFLMNQGYMIVEGAWDITAQQGGASFGVTFPVAKNKDGSTITGPATEEFVIDENATPASEPLTYPAVSADKSQASLTVRENYGDTPQPVPASGWDYTDNTLTAVKLTSGKFGATGSFGPTALYEFTYVAKNPIVAGLGFAALRDLATFLRDAKTDDKGVANPLAGNVRYIYTTCVSQPCRTTRDFLLFGFNEAEKTHARVFDAMLNWIGGGDGIFMNYRFAQPTRTQRQHIARWTPEFQFPFADVPFFDRVTGKYGGRLDTCRRSFTCPKIFEINSENEYWAKGGSMLTTDGQGHDLALESTLGVRDYQLSSLPHGAGTAAGICRQPQNPLIPDQVLRALLVDLDQWVSTGQRPPDNRVPSFAGKTLAPSLPQSGVGFPSIPNPSTTLPLTPLVTYNGILHTGDLWDFGPLFDDGFLTILPPKLLGTPYKIFVPKTDADGNDIAGIRTPDVAVPVATYTGWGLRAGNPADPVPIVDGCDASGQRIPFAETKAARLAAGDPRLSLQERYKDHATYVSLVTTAAQSLEQQRLLLDQDVQNYISAADSASVP
jgi:Alpha/beta hydrolase domain